MPAHSTTKGCTDLRFSLLPNAGPGPPSPHLMDRISHKRPDTPSPPRSKQGILSLVWLPSWYTQSSNKALSEYPVWPLINVCWLKIPRTLVGHMPFRLCTLLGQPCPPFPPCPSLCSRRFCPRRRPFPGPWIRFPSTEVCVSPTHTYQHLPDAVEAWLWLQGGHSLSYRASPDAAGPSQTRSERNPALLSQVPAGAWKACPLSHTLDPTPRPLTIGLPSLPLGSSPGSL